MLKLKRRKGSALLIQLFIVLMVMATITPGLVSQQSSYFSGIEAGGIQLQAQQVADLKASTLKLTPYSNLTDQAITPVPNMDFEDQVIVGAETDIGNGNKQKIATIYVYSTSDSLPHAPANARFVLPVPLTTQGSNSLPTGTILPWWGNLIDIPSGFAYCDGSNGTPNLIGRTIFGSGLWSDSFGSFTYNLGNIGGERKHQLTINEMPSHNHLASSTMLSYQGMFTGDLEFGNSNAYKATIGKVAATQYNGGDQAHNIMPPYVVVHYIMKL